MDAVKNWNYRPFSSPIDQERRDNPFICRIVPEKEKFGFEWFDNGYKGGHTVGYKRYQSLEEEKILPLTRQYMEIDSLQDEQDYEFTIYRLDKEGQSAKRLVRTGYVPGTVINYIHPFDDIYQFSGKFLSSPGLLRLPSGGLMASMDVFGGGGNLTLLFRSDDNGKTWGYVNDLFPAFWGRLFLNQGYLYCLCVDKPYGNLIIGRSEDEGRTWTSPVRLVTVTATQDFGGVHKSSVPVVHHNGKVWSAIEYSVREGELNHRSAALVSANEDSDLLDPNNWKCTEFLPFDRNWKGAPECFHADYIEGNAIVSPDGCVCDYLRLETFYPWKPVYNKAVVLRSDNNDPDAPMKFDRIVDMPVGVRHKFVVQKDPVTGKYIVLGNENGPDKPQRTVLSMSVSDDFYNWKVAKRLIDYRNADPAYVGFQYPDWIFDGEDILFLSRTAFNRAESFHNNNYVTFHTIENYKQYL